jgi:hypothetical protein
MAMHKGGHGWDYLRDRPAELRVPETFNHKISDTVVKDGAIDMLKSYMLSHEDDIAFGINDFDELRHPFEVLIGRQAESKDHNGIKVINGKRVS